MCTLYHQWPRGSWGISHILWQSSSSLFLIIPEAHAYQASPSRTLQRRLQLIGSIPNVHEYLYDRPRTVESVHQTSVASSIDGIDDNYDNNLDTDRLVL